MSKATSVRKFKNLMSTRYVKEGDVITCLYPRHGSKNILRSHTGVVVSDGRGPNGKYVTIQGAGGEVRSLSEAKIIKLKKHLA